MKRTAYFNEKVLSNMLLLRSMLLLNSKIQIAHTGFDVQVSDLEKHLEWAQYLRLRRHWRTAFFE